MTVNFFDKSFLLYAYSILKPLKHIQSGKIRRLRTPSHWPSMILVEKLKTTPQYNPALNEYEIL